MFISSQGSCFRDNIIPNAYSWFTGEANEEEDADDEDDEEDEDDDEEDEEEEEEDEEEEETPEIATKGARKAMGKSAGKAFKPPPGTEGEKPPECKQQ